MAVLMLLQNKNAKPGENIWTSNGPYGASVKTIAINPADHLKLFIGTIHNGIYKTSDAGEHWMHIDSDSLDFVQRQIAIHPFGPDTIYATTVRGAYKSIDGGLSWRNISPPGRERQEFRAIALDPVNPNIILTGGPFDRWKSTDSGQNWYRFSIDPEGGMDFPIEALAINPESTNIVYLLTSSAEFGKGIYKSTDGGETWFNTHNNSDSSGFGEDVVIDPSNTNIIYYVRVDAFRQSIGGHFVSKSTDAGLSWTDISPIVQGEWGARSLVISPSNSDILYLATMGDGVFKSTDAGFSWSTVNSGLNKYNCIDLEIDSIDGSIYLGTVGDGIYKSTNNGASWRKISYNILAQPCTAMAFLLQTPPTAFVVGGSGCYRQTPGDSTWEYVATAVSPRYNLSDISTDRFLPQNMYLTSALFPSYDSDTLGFYLSTDSGQSWNLRSNGLPLDGIYEGIAISYISPSDKRIFLAHNNSMLSGIYCSDNDGQSWSYCGNGLPPPLEAQINIIAVAPNSPNIIAASDYFNNFFISTNRGDSWSQTNFPSPGGSNGFIYEIVFDPYDSLHIFVSGSGYGIFETTDLGNSWEEITHDLPVLSYPDVDGLAINPLNTLNMFVASLGYGVYQTHDGGQTWEPLNVGLDSAYCPGKMYFVPGDTTRLYLVSYGRSVWSIHRTLTGVEDDAPPLPEGVSLSAYPNPFNSSTTLNYSLPKAGHITITICNILGQSVATLYSGIQNAGPHSLAWDATPFSSGLYFARLNHADGVKVAKLLLLK